MKSSQKKVKFDHLKSDCCGADAWPINPAIHDGEQHNQCSKCRQLCNPMTTHPTFEEIDREVCLKEIGRVIREWTMERTLDGNEAHAQIGNAVDAYADSKVRELREKIERMCPDQFDTTPSQEDLLVNHTLRTVLALFPHYD